MPVDQEKLARLQAAAAANKSACLLQVAMIDLLDAEICDCPCLVTCRISQALEELDASQFERQQRLQAMTRSCQPH